MWEKLFFVVYVTISTSGVEDDGSVNYLLDTAEQPKRQISISLKDPLPYKEGEWFAGEFSGKCNLFWTADDNWVVGRIRLCSADTLKTKAGVFTDLYYQEEKSKENAKVLDQSSR